MAVRGATWSTFTETSPTPEGPRRVRVAPRGVVWSLVFGLVASACDEAGSLPPGVDTRSGTVEDTATVDTAAGSDATDAVDTGLGADADTAELADTREPPDAIETLDTGDTAEVDASPPTELRPVLSNESGRMTTLLTGEVSWVTRLDATRVALVREGLFEVLSASGPIALGAAPEAGVRAAALSPQGRVLVAAGEELWVEDGAALVPSPLAAAFDAPVIAMTRGGADLWLSTTGELARLSGSELRVIGASGASLTSALLTPGPVPGGGEGVWLAAEAGVVAVGFAGGRVAATLTSEARPSSLAVDAAGRVWAVVDGKLSRRAPVATGDNTWLEVHLPTPVREVLASPSTPHVWILTETGLVHEVEDQWAQVTSAMPEARARTMTADGSLLFATDEGLVAVSPGRLLSLSGLAPDALLSRPTAIDVRASDPEVAVVAAAIDGQPVATTRVGEGAAAIFRVSLDPEPLARGSHRLTVSVSYPDDGTELSAALSFQVMHITWEDEIEPIYDQRCANCHNASDGASTAVLDHPEAWQDRFDCILCRVSLPIDPDSPECRACEDFASPMPPFGSLSDTELDHLRRWRSDGFREE